MVFVVVICGVGYGFGVGGFCGGVCCLLMVYCIGLVDDGLDLSCLVYWLGEWLFWEF